MNYIKYKSAKREITTKVIYVSSVKMNEDKTAISKLRYHEILDNGEWSSGKLINVEELSKKLFNDEIVAWAGTIDNDNNQFSNVCKIVPMIQDGVFYVTSVTDDEKSNNLENLPGYEK